MAYAYFFSDRHIFFPPHSSYRDTHDVIKIRSQGKLISAIYLPNSKAKYTVLVSHGNAEDLGRMLPFLREFRAQGYAVFAYDYQGYGTSEGRANEEATYADELAAYNYLTQQLKIPPAKIIAYGRSLGAALAIDLAMKKPVAGLIVESGFTSVFRVALPFSLLPFDKYNNLAKIGKISSPVLIIHGMKDEVIPFNHGRKLFEAAPSEKSFLFVQGGGHNNLLSVAGERYWQSIEKFTQAIQSYNQPLEIYLTDFFQGF